MPYLVGFYYNMANMHINKGAMSPKYSVHDHIRVVQITDTATNKTFGSRHRNQIVFFVMIAVHHVNKHRDSRDFDLQ